LDAPPKANASEANRPGRTLYLQPLGGLSSCEKQLPVIANRVLARLLVMPFNDFVSLGEASADENGWA